MITADFIVHYVSVDVLGVKLLIFEIKYNKRKFNYEITIVILSAQAYD